MFDAILLGLGWLGTGLAAILALALTARRRRSNYLLASGLAVAAIASGLITLSHAGVRASWLEAAEVAATLVAGPLFAAWVAHGVGQRISMVELALAVAPLVVWLVLGLSAQLPFGDGNTIRGAVLVQMAWSVACVVLLLRQGARLRSQDRQPLLIGLGLIATLHVAQLARLLAPADTPPNVVPATVGVALGLVSWLAVRDTRVELAGRGADPASDAADDQLLETLDAHLRQVGVDSWRGLSLAQAARQLGVPSHRLSRALNRTGESFPAHLAALRVAEAERLLVDPAVAHLSVEAIGVRAGFGSRSVFFAEFKRRNGTSPAEFRGRALVSRN